MLSLLSVSSQVPLWFRKTHCIITDILIPRKKLKILIGLLKTIISKATYLKVSFSLLARKIKNVSLSPLFTSWFFFMPLSQYNVIDLKNCYEFQPLSYLNHPICNKKFMSLVLINAWNNIVLMSNSSNTYHVIFKW
jgi:hypothetical protein